MAASLSRSPGCQRALGANSRGTKSRRSNAVFSYLATVEKQVFLAGRCYEYSRKQVLAMPINNHSPLPGLVYLSTASPLLPVVAAMPSAFVTAYASIHHVLFAVQAAFCLR